MRYVNSHYNIGNYFTFTIIFQCQMFTIRNTDIVNFLRNWNKPAIALLFISGHVPRHARDMYHGTHVTMASDVRSSSRTSLTATRWKRSEKRTAKQRFIASITKQKYSH